MVPSRNSTTPHEKRLEVYSNTDEMKAHIPDDLPPGVNFAFDSDPEAARYADQALEKALDMSEQLSMFHCDLLLNRRKTSGPYVRHMFGCRIDPTISNEKYREMVLNSFDYAILPIPWRLVQPTEQEFVTQQIDEIAAFADESPVPAPESMYDYVYAQSGNHH